MRGLIDSARRRARSRNAFFKAFNQCFGPGADKRAERADHRKTAGHAALVKCMDGNAVLDEFGDNVGPQVRECQDKVRLPRQNFRNASADECGDVWFFLAHRWRTYGIARHADNAIVLAEEVSVVTGSSVR